MVRVLIRFHGILNTLFVHRKLSPVQLCKPRMVINKARYDGTHSRFETPIANRVLLVTYVFDELFMEEFMYT